MMMTVLPLLLESFAEAVESNAWSRTDCHKQWRPSHKLGVRMSGTSSMSPQAFPGPSVASVLLQLVYPPLAVLPPAGWGPGCTSSSRFWDWSCWPYSTLRGRQSLGILTRGVVLTTHRYLVWKLWSWFWKTLPLSWPKEDDTVLYLPSIGKKSTKVSGRL